MVSSLVLKTSGALTGMGINTASLPPLLTDTQNPVLKLRYFCSIMFPQFELVEDDFQKAATYCETVI